MYVCCRVHATIVWLEFSTKGMPIGALRIFGWRTLLGWVVRFDETYEGNACWLYIKASGLEWSAKQTARHQCMWTCTWLETSLRLRVCISCVIRSKCGSEKARSLWWNSVLRRLLLGILCSLKINLVTTQASRAPDSPPVSLKSCSPSLPLALQMRLS